MNLFERRADSFSSGIGLLCWLLFLQVNEQFCTLMGHEETQIPAQSFQYISFEEDLAADLELSEQLLSGAISKANREKRYLRSDGTQIWALVNAAVVRDEAGEPLHFVVQIQDISERKRIEDELRQSEARKAAILETALDRIIITNAPGNVVPNS